jgi:orotate phosphoribosyltransferase
MSKVKTQKPKLKMRQQLIDLILKLSFKYTKQPAFKLASGRMSNFYFNCKPTTLSSEGMLLIGDLLYGLIKNQKTWKISAIGGLTLGADPIASAIAYTSALRGKPLDAFVIRKQAKKHGTMQWIEGNIKKGDRVLIIEDVITTGGSTIEAIKKARECGLKVKGVVVLIDRQEGGREAIEKMKAPVKVLLTKEEIFKAYKKIN